MDWEDLNYGNMDFGVNPDCSNAKFYIPSASDCMRCGLCLNSCPTFNLFQIEAETPRHRIRIIDIVLNNISAITPEEREHLDNCLQCRACEPVCPSKMAYGELFDATQRQLSRPPVFLAKIAFWFIEHKQWRTRLMPLVDFYLKSGIQQPLRKSGLLKRLHLGEAEALITKPALRKLKSYYPCKTKKARGRIGLFTGCIAEHFDRDTLQASIKLLTAIGFEVTIPAEQSCCGAIHQHNGKSAESLSGNNINTFNSLGLDAIIFVATGCGSMLNEYTGADTHAVDSFKQHLFDINDFLLQHWPEEFKLKPANIKLAVHEPCSQRNTLKNQQSVYELLKKIPGVTISPLPDNHLCCGSGGSYMLTHPKQAAALRAKKIEAMQAMDIDHTVTSNFGCALFLANEEIAFKHPVQFLANYLQE